MSDLYLWECKQDAAFEHPVGNSPKQRHHVRFWRSVELDHNGEPLWLGAATHDERVEVSLTTGGVTHKISADIDKERNKVLVDIHKSGVLAGTYWVDQFYQLHHVHHVHREREGRNGGGDPSFTDGRRPSG